MRKADKRKRGAERQAQNREDARLSGLAAQRGDQQRRKEEQERAIKAAEKRQQKFGDRVDAALQRTLSGS